MNDPLQTLNDILRRNGCNANLHENEGDRYFLFDKITEPKDIDLAWSQFPAHHEIRRRATEVDAVSEIVPGWGYRTPKTSNRCSDVELVALVRQNIESLCPFISDDWDDVRAFIEDGCDIQIVGHEAETPPDAMSNTLFWHCMSRSATGKSITIASRNPL